jgi:hypothetical protein
MPQPPRPALPQRRRPTRRWALATCSATDRLATAAARPAHLFEAMQVMPIRSKVVVCTVAKRKIVGEKISFSALSMSASTV